MQINSALNLVFPIRVTESGSPIALAYHAPISAEVFQANYRIIAATNAAIWGKGLKYASTAGIRVANLTLRDIARMDSAEWECEDQGPAFLSELRRLTTILAPGENGFEYFPVDVALGKKIIDAEDWNEAESALVFFTCGSQMSKKAARKSFCDLIASVIGASITSSNVTEYGSSLASAIAEAAEKAQADQSSPPSSIG